MNKILNNRNSTRAPTHSEYGLFSSKRSQEVFGLSFSMIFSIILIVFFIVTAFIAVKFFLDKQNQIMIGQFFSSLDSKVREVLNSESADITQKYSLPSGIKDICFVNLNAPSINANTNEKDIYTYIFSTSVQNFKNNVYLYTPNANYGLNWKTVNYINTTAHNPICVEVKHSGVSLRFQRKPEGYSVYVSAA